LDEIFVIAVFMDEKRAYALDLFSQRDDYYYF
jgi:hypothetical protein